MDEVGEFDGYLIWSHLSRLGGTTYAKCMSRWPGLNRQPMVYDTIALPLSYIGNETNIAHNYQSFK